MRILLVTSWNTPCGIADFSQQWQENVQAVDRSVIVTPSAEALDPAWALERLEGYAWVYLQHHDALHSRWQPEHIIEIHRRGIRVGVEYHDTFDGITAPNSHKARSLNALADAFVVHEPVADLEGAVLIRQGVHAGVRPFDWRKAGVDAGVLAYPNQPILGTVGFNQGWREFGKLAELTARCGWALVLLSNNATAEDEAVWRATNPYLFCARQWLPAGQLVSFLAGCDATCFIHQCANAGTSGAIRLGLAARKPVIAGESRQYRDLRAAEGNSLIRWCAGLGDLQDVLGTIPIQPVDPGIVFLAARDAWTVAGRRYAELLQRELRRG